MIGHNAQQLDTKLPHLKSNTPEEGSEFVEEPGQRLQDTRMQLLQRHEWIRMLILGIGLLTIILSTVFFGFYEIYRSTFWNNSRRTLVLLVR